MSRTQRKAVWIAIAAATLLAMGAPPVIRRAREAARSMSCANNAIQIAIAIHNYEDTYGQMPRAATLDDEGTPIHSWRPALIPFMGPQQFYRWDEPWDGPFNVRLAKGLDIHVPAGPTDETGRKLSKTIGPYDGPINYAWQYQCSHTEAPSNYNTNFFAVVGSETVWPPNRDFALEDIGDGVANTILVVESHTLNAIWSQPEDLDYDQMSFVINDPDKPGISSPHPKGPLVVFADCMVFHLNPKTPERVIRAMLTANGGEDLPRSRLIEDGWLR